MVTAATRAVYPCPVARPEVLPASGLRLPESSTGSTNQRKSPQYVLVGPWPWRGSMDGLETRNRTNAEPDTCLTRPAKTHCGRALDSTSPCRPVPPVATRTSSRHDGRATVGRGRVFRAFRACFFAGHGLRCLAGRWRMNDRVERIPALRSLASVIGGKEVPGLDGPA